MWNGGANETKQYPQRVCIYIVQICYIKITVRKRHRTNYIDKFNLGNAATLI